MDVVQLGGVVLVAGLFVGLVHHFLHLVLRLRHLEITGMMTHILITI